MCKCEVYSYLKSKLQNKNCDFCGLKKTFLDVHQFVVIIEGLIFAARKTILI